MTLSAPQAADSHKQSRYFSIDNVQLRHFRSIARCDVNLGPLTLLVGANGSGKSSFLDALRLMSEALQTSLDHALRDRGGLPEVRRRAHGHPTHFGIRLSFQTEDLRGSYGFQVAAVKGGDHRISHEECTVLDLAGESDSNIANVASFRIRDGELTNSTEDFMPPPADTDRLHLVRAASIPIFREVLDGLVGINVYNLNPDAMRSLSGPDAGDLLLRDGANIGSVLERLKRERPDSKERIEEYLKRVADGVEWVDRKALGSFETIEIGQRVAGAPSPWAFQATSVSDGTLRALGVLTALFSGPERVLSPIGIEEPESALHPAASGLLLEALRDASHKRQVLVTSHSPDLIDSASISPRELLAVTASEGQTTIGEVDESGMFALTESLYTPGELMRIDQLRPRPDHSRPKALFR